MRAPILLLLASISTLAFVPACSKDAPPSPPSSAADAPKKTGLPDRDPALAHKLVDEGAVLLDVRTTDEFAERHLDKSVNVPVGELQSRLGEVEKLTGGDKKKPIVVYCQAGGRAAKAKKMLTEAGYEQVTNLGGIDDWNTK